MSLRTLLSRRRVIATLIAAAAVWRYRASPSRDADAARAARMLVALFTDPLRAHAIGAAYARTLPPEQRTAVQLTRAVVESPQGIPIRFETVALLRSSIGARIAHDFTRGDIVCVDGWMLAVTEARLCALATLPPRSR